MHHQKAGQAALDRAPRRAGAAFRFQGHIWQVGQISRNCVTFTCQNGHFWGTEEQVLETVRLLFSEILSELTWIYC